MIPHLMDSYFPQCLLNLMTDESVPTKMAAAAAVIFHLIRPNVNRRTSPPLSSRRRVANLNMPPELPALLSLRAAVAHQIRH